MNVVGDLTCGNINTLHLNNTNSNLQNQINDISVETFNNINDIADINERTKNITSVGLKTLTNDLESINYLCQGGAIFQQNLNVVGDLTCGNINTSHLNNTTSNLQTQITNLNTYNAGTKYITANNNFNTTIDGTITTGNVNAGGNLNAGGNVTAVYDVTINGVSVANSIIPIGAVQIFAGTTVPTGFLLCNGASISKTTYSKLFAVIGDAYLYTRTASTTNFYIPDLRGLFVRGVGVNNTYGSISGGGNFAGSYQSDSVQRHLHKYDKANASINVISSISAAGISFNVNTSSVYDNTSASTNTASTAYDTDGTTILADETRPHNLGMNYIIKY